jgi:hypothetical protein
MCKQPFAFGSACTSAVHAFTRSYSQLVAPRGQVAVDRVQVAAAARACAPQLLLAGAGREIVPSPRSPRAGVQHVARSDRRVHGRLTYCAAQRLHGASTHPLVGRGRCHIMTWLGRRAARRTLTLNNGPARCRSSANSRLPQCAHAVLCMHSPTRRHACWTRHQLDSMQLVANARLLCVCVGVPSSTASMPSFSRPALPATRWLRAHPVHSGVETGLETCRVDALRHTHTQVSIANASNCRESV